MKKKKIKSFKKNQSKKQSEKNIKNTLPPKYKGESSFEYHYRVMFLNN
ncbi:hypothetical protein [Carnobacterium maltaromaticum]|nr:hypothetical protein [Carnobacterium maltaromaticum]